jgi:hypothetical protein
VVIGKLQGSKCSSRGLSPEESAIDENEAARGMRSERADDEQRNVALLNEKESAFTRASTSWPAVSNNQGPSIRRALPRPED